MSTSSLYSSAQAKVFHEFLRYEAESGKLFWKVSPRHSSVRAGDEACSTDATGYLKVTLQGRNYLVHRVVWLLHTGSWPDGQLDHINGVRDDNRLNNLREVTSRENNQNRACHRDGKIVGSTRANSGRWEAKITLNGKSTYLGTFDTDQEAHRAYIAASKKDGRKP